MPFLSLNPQKSLVLLSQGLENMLKLIHMHYQSILSFLEMHQRRILPCTYMNCSVHIHYHPSLCQPTCSSSCDGGWTSEQSDKCHNQTN